MAKVVKRGRPPSRVRALSEQPAINAPLVTPRHITRDIRHGVVEAALQHGSDGRGRGGLVGYLRFLAGKHPRAFAPLLSKLIPYEAGAQTMRNYVGSVTVVSVPANRFLSSEEIKARALAAAEPLPDLELTAVRDLGALAEAAAADEAADVDGDDVDVGQRD